MPKTFLRKRQVAARYGGVTTRTIDRWAEDGRLPPPIFRGRVPLWDLDELEAQDRAAATAARTSHKPVVTETPAETAA
jgi:predicted DNA-binding transcriptional regulator AlpA